MTRTRTLAEAAHGCRLLARARAVAAFVGAGRPVSTNAVLRRADPHPPQVGSAVSGRS